MKHKLSISIEYELILKVFERMSQCRGQYKNKSHFIECAVKKFLEESPKSGGNSAIKVK